MQVICLGAACHCARTLLLFLPFSSQTITDKCTGLGCLLSQQLVVESKQYLKQQTQRGWLGSLYSNILTKLGATLQRVRCTGAPPK